MILGKCNIYDYLIIWLLVVQFCLQSCSWFNRTPASRRAILLIAHGMITDRIGLHSVLLLLQIQLSVDHIKKTTKAIYSTSYPLTMTLISYVLPMLWVPRLNELDRKVSDKIADSTDQHLGTLKFLVRLLIILNKSEKYLRITVISAFFPNPKFIFRL